MSSFTIAHAVAPSVLEEGRGSADNAIYPELVLSLCETGGPVYRGSSFADILDGALIFADYTKL